MKVLLDGELLDWVTNINIKSGGLFDVVTVTQIVMPPVVDELKNVNYKIFDCFLIKTDDKGIHLSRKGIGDLLSELGNFQKEEEDITNNS